MKKVILIAWLLIYSLAASAYVIICPLDGGEGPRHNCLEISQINIDGEWVEATCDNYDPPEGWVLMNCF